MLTFFKLFAEIKPIIDETKQKWLINFLTFDWLIYLKPIKCQENQPRHFLWHNENGIGIIVSVTKQSSWKFSEECNFVVNAETGSLIEWGLTGFGPHFITVLVA